MRAELIKFLMEYSSYKTCEKCRQGQMIPEWYKLVCENCGYTEFIDDRRGA